MGGSRLAQLEDAVGRLLQRNAQLQDLCHKLLVEQDDWNRERRELLEEVESILAELEIYRERRV